MLAPVTVVVMPSCCAELPPSTVVVITMVFVSVFVTVVVCLKLVNFANWLGSILFAQSTGNEVRDYCEG